MLASAYNFSESWIRAGNLYSVWQPGVEYLLQWYSASSETTHVLFRAVEHLGVRVEPHVSYTPTAPVS